MIMNMFEYLNLAPQKKSLFPYKVYYIWWSFYRR